MNSAKSQSRIWCLEDLSIPLPKADISLAPLVLLVLGTGQHTHTICWEGIGTQSSPSQTNISNDRDIVASLPPGSINLSFLYGFINSYKDYVAQHNIIITENKNNRQEPVERKRRQQAKKVYWRDSWMEFCSFASWEDRRKIKHKTLRSK